MRTVLLLTFIVVLLTSCSKYQYYTLASDNTSKDRKQQFVVENDTCKISYNFSGPRGPIGISIYNKTNKPLQVDWKRSALILGDSSISFFEPQMQFNGEIERSRYLINDVTGTVTQPESIDFIPPRSAITKHGKYVGAKFIKPTSQGQPMEIASQRARVHKFTKGNSPITFRIYLTLISENSSFAIERSFYAAELIEIHIPPQDFTTGDRFFVKGKTGFGQVSTVVFSVGLFALLIAAF